MKALHRVVIVGGGFGGLYTAKALRNVQVQVTLIDRHNYHLFQPLLYQVATGFLPAENVASPLRVELKKQKNVRVFQADITDIDVNARKVSSEDFEMPYDTLILAAGANFSYFGHPEWESFAPGLKSVDDAYEVRRRVFLAFENAEKIQDPGERQRWLTFVIVGAGPTGVEMSGALGETVRHTLRSGYHTIQPEEVRILLLEGGDRVLPAYSPDLSSWAEQDLTRLGVTVCTNNMVTGLNAHSVSTRTPSGPQTISTETILWAAGVQASPLGQVLQTHTGAPVDRSGRVIVAPDLTVPGYPEIFVIGDLANFSHQAGKPLPGLVQPAMQEGIYVAHLIQCRLNNETLPAFNYHDKGSMATIGRGSALADLGKIRLTGLSAKLIWIFIHIWNIVELENRALVFLQWVWNFLTLSQHARAITSHAMSQEQSPAAFPPVSPPSSKQVESINRLKEATITKS